MVASMQSISRSSLIFVLLVVMMVCTTATASDRRTTEIGRASEHHIPPSLLHPFMPMAATDPTPVHVDTTILYFDTPWSILSCLCGTIVILAFSVQSILGSFSNLGWVIITVSTAGAIANGLCYYAYWEEWTIETVKVSAAFADVFWGIQEIGLSVYSLIILFRILRGQAKLIYLSLFCTLFAIAAGFRVAVVVERQIYLATDTTESRQHTVDNMHSGYFAAIALMELVNGFFLLRSFSPSANGARNSVQLFRSIARSSEFRLAFLFCTGFGRAVCYNYQSSTRYSNNPAAIQVDRFFYYLECFYPVVLLVDMMGTKIASFNRVGGPIGSVLVPEPKKSPNGTADDGGTDVKAVRTPISPDKKSGDSPHHALGASMTMTARKMSTGNESTGPTFITTNAPFEQPTPIIRSYPEPDVTDTNERELATIMVN